jgi:hypothetical protein
MSRPFNFLQYEEGQDGVYPVNSLPSDFTGVYFPQNVSQSKIIYIDYDDTYKPSTLIIAESGLFNGVILNTYNFYNFLSGEIFPASNDSQNFYFQYSGQITGQPVDYSNFLSTLSGNYLSDNVDTSKLYSLFSGQNNQILKEISNIYFSLSGNFNGIEFEQSSFSVNFYGNIKPQYKENANLNCVINYIDYQKGQLRININYEELGYIGFAITGITYSKN